jgi:hypothetical protein
LLRRLLRRLARRLARWLRLLPLPERSVVPVWAGAICVNLAILSASCFVNLCLCLANPMMRPARWAPIRVGLASFHPTENGCPCRERATPGLGLRWTGVGGVLGTVSRSATGTGFILPEMFGTSGERGA